MPWLRMRFEGGQRLCNREYVSVIVYKCPRRNNVETLVEASPVCMCTTYVCPNKDEYGPAEDAHTNNK